MDPASISWLSPSVDPRGLRLVAAHLDLLADCGPTSDCVATMPSATLAYDTDDLGVRRSLQIVQANPTSGHSGFGEVPDGVQRTLGNRSVVATEHSDPSLTTINVAWTEPDGLVAELFAIGLTWAELGDIVATLTRIEPEGWPGTPVQQPQPRCVDARTQYAPLTIPDGWQRFVLAAQPTGTCGVSQFLMMSLVSPGTPDHPGMLATFVTSPASEANPQPGNRITINDHDATVQQSTLADGTPATSIDMIIDDVAINSHGNIDVAGLTDLMATIGPLSDEQWAQLVSEVGAK